MEPAPAPCGELAPPPDPRRRRQLALSARLRACPASAESHQRPPIPPHPRGCSGSAFVSLARAPPVPDGGSLFLQERPC